MVGNYNHKNITNVRRTKTVESTVVRKDDLRDDNSDEHSVALTGALNENEIKRMNIKCCDSIPIIIIYLIKIQLTTTVESLAETKDRLRVENSDKHSAGWRGAL